MTRSYRYVVVDVFTNSAREGNALAVSPDARGLDDRAMQLIAREMNLSETTFVLPPSRADCVAAVRIFTPLREMAFAGHPTIGTSFVLLREKVVAADARNFRLEEQVGPVPVRVGDEEKPLIWLQTPPIEFGQVLDAKLCGRSIGLARGELLDVPPQLVSAGNPTVFVGVRTQSAVDEAILNPEYFARLKQQIQEPSFIFVFSPTASGAYSRMFAPDHGVPEDPATGSSTGPLAAYMMRHGMVSNRDQTRFVSEQGTKMGRRSLLHVHVHGENGDEGIDVGGHVTAVADARLTI